MNATDKEKMEMNATPATNQRLVTILLALLIILVALLVIGIVWSFLMMGNGMMTGGMMNMTGMNGQTMNDMMTACAEMMKAHHGP